MPLESRRRPQQYRLWQECYKTIWRCLSYAWALHWVRCDGRIKPGEAGRFTFRQTILDGMRAYEASLCAQLRELEIDPSQVVQIQGQSAKPKPPIRATTEVRNVLECDDPGPLIDPAEIWRRINERRMQQATPAITQG